MNRIKRFEFEQSEVQAALVEYLERHYGLEVCGNDAVLFIAHELVVEIEVEAREHVPVPVPGSGRTISVTHAPSVVMDIETTACGLDRGEVTVVPPSEATCQRCRDVLGMGYPDGDDLDRTADGEPSELERHRVGQ